MSYQFRRLRLVHTRLSQPGIYVAIGIPVPSRGCGIYRAYGRRCVRRAYLFRRRSAPEERRAYRAGIRSAVLCRVRSVSDLGL